MYTKWYVWNTNSLSMPTYQHHDEVSAVKESQRLAKLNPGVTFVVLKTVGETVLPLSNVTYTKHEDDNIPF